MPNRMSKQTKSSIIASFFELLQVMPYSKLTIKGISQNAGISRRTFYRFFKSKEDLLQDYFDNLLNDYLTTLKKYEPRDFENFIKLFFDFWKGNMNQLKLLEQRDLLTNMLSIYNKKIPQLYESFPTVWHLKTSNNKEIAVATWFIVGGLWNVFVGCLANDSTYDDYNLAKVINNTIFQMGEHD